MIALGELTEFLGWTVVVNTGVLVFASLLLAFGRSFIAPIHSKILGLNDAELNQMYASYLANYKIAVLVLGLSPYIALKIMGY